MAHSMVKYRDMLEKVSIGCNNHPEYKKGEVVKDLIARETYVSKSNERQFNCHMPRENQRRHVINNR